MQHNYSVQSIRNIGRGIALGLVLLATAPLAATAQLVDDRNPGSTRLPDLRRSTSAQFPQDSLGTSVAPTRAVDPSVYTSEEYLLGPGDVVQVDFFNVPELSGQFQVLPNGTINLPQMGSVPVRGRTLAMTEQAVSAKAASILRYPVVTVGLERARPITVAIAGEVTSPGTYTLRPGDGTTAGTIPSLTETLRLAQGVTQSADLSIIEIRRPNSAGRGVNVVTVNLWDLVNRGDINQDLRLRDGDSVFVPPSSGIDPEVAWQMSDMAFATPPDRPMQISIMGEVNRPGPYTLTGESFRNSAGNTVSLQVPTITRAIQTAGGITQAADVRKIVLKRTTRTGPGQELTVDFWKLLKEGDFKQDVALQDGDTIEIQKVSELNDSDITEVASASFSPDEINVMVAGEVDRPGQVQLPPNTPLNQALLAAGGFNERARKGKVTLLRLNPNGSVTKKKIDVDLSADVNSEQNPAMRNGDSIFVDRSSFSTAGEIIRGVTTPFTGIWNMLRLLGNGLDN